MAKNEGEEGIAVCWLRRDLRLFDNTALYHALKSGLPVQVIFIFDPAILQSLPQKKDRRVAFIHRQLEKINAELSQFGASLFVLHDLPEKAFEKLIFEYPVREVYTNHDYEAYARSRDKAVSDFLLAHHVQFHSYKDQVIFEKEEVLKPNGTPYTVFTPYSRKWKEQLQQNGVPGFPSEDYLPKLLKKPNKPILSLAEIGFETTDPEVAEADLSEELIKHYHKNRDLPYIDGTSRAGVHLRFGTVSIRHLVKQALQQNEAWLNELIWREFFMMILYHFPHVEQHNFRRKYDRIQWRNNEKEFEAWCRGETGYPLVDAGMRQLNETGWMHNRVRMVVAGFLCKHLLIDWRWGEAYFAEKLLDYELASNNGNWQWAAGTGCDSAPYFRIFNPESQLKKFDPKLEYVKTWIKDFRAGYLEPIVDHKFARARALETYKKALS
ncbi:deoxyribodipyrimidine photo-lyase [Salinimicrobium tongyeongense]|uniref:Deoxyribodipyrimidine photo-lyase n=1 Tax=Salinimicrobium tongyeongense TaxID=2809707 RepID=A0ABY6NTY5_9FLAO|nr:deoxyribodipyrimidine photo-lyase [Salinimicrobium tongyeongense]UZH55948.1 deoxyribodipyrimidine photo-lyase [Salinimicrobium tongyeongense]